MTATGAEQDVVELLIGQHQQVKTLFGRLSTAQGEARRDAFQDLVRLLAVHESAEEIVVHPAVQRLDNVDDSVVSERREEENEAKQALSHLYDLGVDHPEFDGKCAELSKAVLAHAEHEEREEFPALRRLPAEERKRMAGAVRAAESAAPTRPHPAVGESAAMNLLAGPPLAVFDRVRDKVRDWRSTHAD